MNSERSIKKTIIGILVSGFCFGTMETALKIAGSKLDPIQMTFLRFLIAAIVLAPFAVRETRVRMNAGMEQKTDVSGPLSLREAFSVKDLAWLFLVGAVGVALSMSCFQFGVENSNAATAAGLMCTNPLFTMLIAHFFTQEKMTGFKWIAFFLGLIAIIFMIRPWDVQEGNSPFGITMMLIAATTFGAYTVMGKRTVGRIGVFTQTSISFFFGSLILLIILCAMNRPVVAGITENLLIVLYCGVFVTGVGYLFYFIGIKASDATTGSMTFFIKPVIAPILAVLILHERVLWNTIIGIVLLIAASALTIYDAKRSRPS